CSLCASWLGDEGALLRLRLCEAGCVVGGRVVRVLSVTSAIDRAEPGIASFTFASPVAVTAPSGASACPTTFAPCNPSSGSLVLPAKESLQRCGRPGLRLVSLLR